MNLTPLALAAAYAYLNKGDKEQAPAPAATPAITPAPAAQIPPRTDMTQMFGATQDVEDMAAGPMGGQAPSRSESTRLNSSHLKLSRMPSSA